MKKMKDANGLGPEDAPKLGAAFVMARFNIREMPEVVRALIPLGLNHFFAQNLEACTSPEVLGPHLLYTDPVVREEAVRHVEETKGLCAAAGARVVDVFPDTLLAWSWSCEASPGSSCAPGPFGDHIDDFVDLAVGGTATYLVMAIVDPSIGIFDPSRRHPGNHIADDRIVRNTASVTPGDLPDPFMINNILVNNFLKEGQIKENIGIGPDIVMF